MSDFGILAGQDKSGARAVGPRSLRGQRMHCKGEAEAGKKSGV